MNAFQEWVRNLMAAEFVFRYYHALHKYLPLLYLSYDFIYTRTRTETSNMAAEITMTYRFFCLFVLVMWESHKISCVKAMYIFSFIDCQLCTRSGTKLPYII